jgi:uncharacterized membrane protein
MATWKRWQDWANVIVGILLFISPFVFRAMGDQPAEWTAWIGGVLLVIVGLYDLSAPANRAGQWIEGLLGILVFIAPWVLGFSGFTAMAWTAWILGAISVILAAWVLFAEGTQTRSTLVGQH